MSSDSVRCLGSQMVNQMFTIRLVQWLGCVFTNKERTTGWKYGQSSGALILCNWSNHLGGFVGWCVCMLGADFIAVFFCTLFLRLTPWPWWWGLDLVTVTWLFKVYNNAQERSQSIIITVFDSWEACNSSERWLTVQTRVFLSPVLVRKGLFLTLCIQNVQRRQEFHALDHYMCDWYACIAKFCLLYNSPPHPSTRLYFQVWCQN